MCNTLCNVWLKANFSAYDKKAENRKPDRHKAKIRYLHSMTEDYSQIVDHISVPDWFSYLPIIDSSCHFGLKTIFHGKNYILNVEKGACLSLVKAKDKKFNSLFNLPSGFLHLKIYHLQQFISHCILSFLNFFLYSWDISHSLSSILQGGLFVCEK